MKTLALACAIAAVSLSACADKVTRKTTTYNQTSTGAPGAVAAPSTVIDDDGTTTTSSRTTRRVETVEKD